MKSGWNERTKIEVDYDRGVVCWMYYNPDSVSRGQYVYGEIEFADFLDSVEFFDLDVSPDHAKVCSWDIEEQSKQYLSDNGTEEFEAAEREYMRMNAYTEFTAENILSIYRQIRQRKQGGRLE